MSLQDIRDKLQQNWAQLDKTGDGKIDVDDLLAYDTDGSGTLSRDELQKLAHQLSQQVEYNNALLEQMREIEERQLAMQREMKEKQSSLKQAVSVGDSARNDANDLRRKLAISQEVADNMSNQCREARVEVSAQKRELETANKEREELHHGLIQAKEEKTQYENRMSAMRDRLSLGQEDSDRRVKDLEHQLQGLQDAHSILSKEHGEIRARQGPLETENSHLKEKLRELQETVDDLTKRIESESKARETSERKVRDTELHLSSAREKQKELQFMINEERARSVTLQERSSVLDGTVSSVEGQLMDREAKLVELSRQHKEVLDENMTLKGELETVGNELLQGAKQRSSEQERWAVRLAESQEEVKKMTDEVRSQAQEYAFESQRKSEEMLKQRRQTEEQYVSLQQEHAELHSLLQKLQQDNRGQLASFERERLANEKRGTNQFGKISELEKAMDDVRKAATAAEKQSEREQNKLRTEISKRGESYVTVLTALKEAMKRVMNEAQVCRDAIRQISADYTTVVAFVSTIAEKQGKPLQSWFEETRQVMELMTEGNKNLKKEVEDSKDDLRRSQLEKEEERAKTLMLDERVSQMEHELSLRDSKLDETEKKHTDRLSQVAKEKDSVASQKDDLESRSRRMQQAIDAATAQNRSLQSNVQGVQLQLADSQARSAAKATELEQKLEELTVQLRNTHKEKDGVTKHRNEIQHQLSTAEGSVTSLQAAIARLEAEKGKATADSQDIAGRSRDQLSNMQASLKRYEDQQDHTKNLLKVVQEQRAELQEDNMQLRAELDDLYKQNIGGAGARK